MAITAATRNDLIELAVIANNSSPGTTLLMEMIGQIESGKTLTEIGDALAARSEFKAVYPGIQTADEFAKEYVGNLLPEASDALKTECETIVAAHVNAGKGLGELFVGIHGVLTTTAATDATLGTLVSNFTNKVTVATYHTIELETAAESTAVLASVDSTDASVTTGKAAADPVVVTAPSATYSLSANAASVNEGETAVFTLDTTNVASGSELSYTVTGVNGSDISGSTVGSVKVGADGKGVIAVSAVADTTTEGAETLTVSVAGQTASTTVNDTSVTAPPAAETIALTTGIDNKTTGAGDDSFSGTNATLTTGDILNGGEGTDNLSITASLTAASAVNGFTTSSVESANINIIDGNVGANHVLTVNMVDAPIAAVTVSGTSTTGQADGVTFTNVDSSTAFTLSGSTNLDATITYDAAWLAGAGDAQTLTVSGNTYSAAADNDIAFTGGIETLTVNAIGSANKIGNLAWGGAGLTVTGDQNLTIADTLAVTANTIDASAFTGKLSVVVGNATDKAAVGGVDILDLSVKGGSGNDTIDVSAADTGLEISVEAGAGNDTVTIGANTVKANALGTLVADKVDGGDGIDSIKMTTALANSATKANNVTVTNFEALQVSNANTNSITLNNIQSGLNSIVLLAGSNGGTTVLGAGASTVTSTAPNAGAYTVTDTALATALDDSVTIGTTSLATVDMGNNNAFNFTGIETVTFNTTTKVAADMELDVSTISMTSDTGTGATDTLNITGTGTFHASGSITADVINFSGMDTSGHAATVTIANMGAVAVGVTTITGSDGKDILVGDAKSTINGGGGADTITGGSGNDTLNGGDGKDGITTNAGNDTVDGGAGDDTITFAANLTKADKVAGGDGTDTLSVSNASLVAIQGQTISEANTFNTNFTGVEKLTVTGAMDTTGDSFDLGYLAGVNFVTLATLSNDAETITGFDSGGTLVLTETLTNTVTATVNSAATGAADALTIKLFGSADDDYGLAVAANIETLTIDATEVTAAAASRTGTVGLTLSQTSALAGGSGAAQTLNIIGSEDVVIDTTVNVATINASGMSARLATTPGLVMSNATGHSKAQTITGSSGADIIIGSSKGDTIDAGAGNDSITGGTGADSITGGTGTDVAIYTTAVTAGNIEGTGTGTATGIVINLGATAVSNATVLGTTTQSLSGGSTSVASNTVAYLFNGSAPTNSTVVDTLSGIENVTVADGINYIIGSDGANTITGGSGVDTIVSGKGNDTVIPGAGIDSVTTGAGTDTISLTGIAVVANRVTVTDFATTTDIIGLDVDNTTVATAAGATPTIEDEATAANQGNGITYNLGSATATNTNALDIVTLDTAVLANIANADLSLSTTGVELLKALVVAGAGKTAASITLNNNNDKLYLAVDDGTNGYLYFVDTAGGGAGNAIAQAAEILLVGTFSGDADFGDIVVGNIAMVA
ncbi:MAG: hypothetical protein P8N40_11435 [Gammaproteobacteria bacterium]|nr:hypothetical protein [Gammaproteobacteria bacterium]